MCGPEAGQGLSWPWSECQEILVLPCWTLGALCPPFPEAQHHQLLSLGLKMTLVQCCLLVEAWLRSAMVAWAP